MSVPSATIRSQQGRARYLVAGYLAIVGERRAGSLRILLGYPHAAGTSSSGSWWVAAPSSR
ncbi:MAG: hypothetical protein ABEJ57_07160 [Halobacteriaceae archaeon]